MYKAPKKRKIDEENRKFNEKWTFDYFFINNYNKALCLICKESISVFKEFNLRRHYDTKHKSEYDQFETKFRQNKIDSLQQSLEAQDDFQKCMEQSSALIKTSSHISKLIVEHNKLFMDGKMYKAPKKRKIDKENRKFNEKWTFDYFFINNYNEALCLICKESISVFKEFNLRRHYDTKHKSEYDQLETKFRQNKIDSLQQSLEAQQDDFKKYMEQSPALIKTSSHISKLIAENNKLLTDVSSCKLHSRSHTIELVTHEKENSGKNIAARSTKYEFQAETRMLLDIVARSLYSEKEVFIRELISNASDALEKFRSLLSHSTARDSFIDPDRTLDIQITTDKQNRTLTITDSGIGMSKEELVSNLGVVARSGLKAFLEQLKDKQGVDNAGNIIGQFGVGFYSAFMVADNVEVFSRAANEQIGHKWASDGTGSYEIQEMHGLQPGTKIVMHLKLDCREFSDEETINALINKYSNFVGSLILLNGKKLNTVQPLWLMDPKSITPQQHSEFYRYISGAYDLPRFTLHYNTDVPISIHALLYVPDGKPGLFELSRETETGVALYTRKVLIKSRVDNILPKWLRFIKGVVDSDDIPLNLSRELLQNSALIQKLGSVLTSRILKFLYDQSKKKPEEYLKFYADYGLFLKVGIITNHNQTEKEDIAKLLRFESSHNGAGVKVSLDDYLQNTKGDEKTIFYLAAPSRALAEASPYFESLKTRQQAVLFCYEPYDELVLMQLQQFKGYRVVSLEKDMRDDKKATDLTNLGDDSLKRSEIEELTVWMKDKLAGKAATVNATTRLENHPCVVTVEEMAAARHFIRTQSHQLSEERRYALLQPQLELNPRHPIVKKLHKLTKTNTKLAELVTEQLFTNSMVGAGLVDDPRILLTSMNELLAKALEKH